MLIIGQRQDGEAPVLPLVTVIRVVRSQIGHVIEGRHPFRQPHARRRSWASSSRASTIRPSTGQGRGQIANASRTAAT